jgi:hypothetical protein
MILFFPTGLSLYNSGLTATWGDAMCDDPEETVTKAVAEVVGKAVEKTLDSESAKNLLGPVTSELGLTLGEIGSVVKFYTSENLRRVFTKWAQQRQRQPINSSEFKSVLPLLHQASLQSDDELQERWAALLESTVTGSRNVLPSFGNTLSQLSADEARYLDDLWTAVNRKDPLQDEPYRRNKKYFDFRFMGFVFDPELEMNLFETHRRKEPLSSEQMKAILKRNELQLIVQDFERLGIIGTKTELVQGESDWIEADSKEVEIPGGAALSQETFFTPYGRSFIKAVSPKHKLLARNLNSF